MRIACAQCRRPATNELSDEVVIDAILVCRQCFQEATVVFGRKNDGKIIWHSPPPWKTFGEVTGRIVCPEIVAPESPLPSTQPKPYPYK